MMRIHPRVELSTPNVIRATPNPGQSQWNLFDLYVLIDMRYDGMIQWPQSILLLLLLWTVYRDNTCHTKWTTIILNDMKENQYRK